jgi:aryl-alcohol dehydrogenase-like predicted oxidoreductase
MPTGTLGRTGARVSRMGLGCAYVGRDSMRQDEALRLLHRALDLGITYFDVAPNYGHAEEKMGPFVQEVRDRIFLVTKIESATREDAWQQLRNSMQLLQTDHFDLVHIHNFGHEPRFPDLALTLGPQGVLGALREARQQGVVRFIGASGHLHPSRFHAALDTGEIDVLMNAVNFINRHTYDFEHKVWARAYRDSLGLVAMKVLGGNDRNTRQCKIPTDYYQRAIRYALSLPGISCAVLGMQTIPELEQAVATVSRAQPLTDDEMYALAREGMALARQPEWKALHGTPVL